MAKKTDGIFDLDLTKMFSELRMPGVDLNALADYQKRNIEALTAANKVAIDGMQAIMRRQGELARQLMDDSAAAASRLASVPDVRGRMECQVALVKEAIERASAVAREMADMMTNSNAEVTEVLNARLTAALDEVRDALHALPASNPLMGDALLRAQVATSAADAEQKPAAKAAAPRPAAAKVNGNAKPTGAAAAAE